MADRTEDTGNRAPRIQTAEYPKPLDRNSLLRRLRSELTYRYNLVQGKWIEDAILVVIQRVSWYVQNNEKEFMKRVREVSDRQQEQTVMEEKNGNLVLHSTQETELI